MTGHYYKTHGNAAVIRAGTTTLSISHPEWGAHIRSTVTVDTQGWVHVPMMVPTMLDGRKLKLRKVEVAWATGWKTIFDAIQVYMGDKKVMDKADFGYSKDSVNTVEFEVPGSPQINQGVSISLLFTIPSGDNVHGRWATVSSVGAYISPV
ncbi:hypothetical protein BJY00DRAFT_314677 [Aspergillus carlsbadensis]|nr:hypothetical protein BJY00DRAFT_314677 [Aspergillus carlsbadensis]